MAQKRKEESEFKVSDRRLFTSDGELRDSEEEQSATASRSLGDGSCDCGRPSPRRFNNAAEAPRPLAAATCAPNPISPSRRPLSEQQAQHDAYKQSSRDLDARVELSGHSAKELEMSFERFMASLYMTAMMQLGLMHEQGGQPGVDLIGARQTIDTLGMIAEKTKGNLTPKEQGFLQNCLYELRMAYVEVTNALAHPPQAPGPVTGTNG